jgi:hypothetical protein
MVVRITHTVPATAGLTGPSRARGHESEPATGGLCKWRREGRRAADEMTGRLSGLSPAGQCWRLQGAATSTSFLGRRQLRVVAVGGLVSLPLPRIVTVEHAVARKTCVRSLPAYPGKHEGTA